MDAAQALADLTEISSQVGPPSCSTGRAGGGLDARGRASALASSRELAKRCSTRRRARARAGAGALAQLEVATLEGSVFVVRERRASIAATTRPEPTVGLVFYDLQDCLRSLSRRRRRQPSPRRASAETPAGRAAPPEDGDAEA